MIFINRKGALCLPLFITFFTSAQSIQKNGEKLFVKSGDYQITFDCGSGTIDYVFPNGTYFKDIVSVFHDVKLGRHASNEFAEHT